MFQQRQVESSEKRPEWNSYFIWIIMIILGGFYGAMREHKLLAFNVVLIGCFAFVGIYQIGKQSFRTDNPIKQALFVAGATLLAYETIFVVIFCFKQLYVKGLL